jgi:hypothetical protein
VTVRRATFLAALDSARSIHSSPPSSFEEVRIDKDLAALACLQPPTAVHYRYSGLSIKSAQLSISRTLSKHPTAAFQTIATNHHPHQEEYCKVSTAISLATTTIQPHCLTTWRTRQAARCSIFPRRFGTEFTSMSFRMCLFATHGPITLAWSTLANSCVLSWNPSSLRKRLHGWK